MLVGDDPGVGEVAREFSALHAGEVAQSELGTPALDSAFRSVDEIAAAGLRCFVNSDIVLTNDLLAAVAAVRRFPAALPARRPDSRSSRRRCRPRRSGRARGNAHFARAGCEGRLAIDWFVFPSGLFDPLPPFLVGRAGFDNWMIWKARQLGPVIDATDAVVAIHQPHDYAHLAGGKHQAYYGDEAKQNVA